VSDRPVDPTAAATAAAESGAGAATPGTGEEQALTRWLTLGVVATAAIVLSFPLYLVRDRLTAPSTGSDAEMATFVGREQCIDCHESAYEAWKASDHDNAMDVATDSTVRGDFTDTEFVHDGATSRFYRRDEKFFVYTEGPGGEMGEFEITHTFGWEPLQQYLVPFPGGRLQALGIAWDTERNEWFDLYPDQDIPASDWLHWTRNAQNWNGMCAECHSTNLIKGYDPDTETFSTTWSEIDVSCEACHGPGSRHVEWADMPEMARPDIENYGLLIGTSDMSTESYVELCAPCHARRTELGDYDHTSPHLMDNVLPAVLREGLYHADGQILDEVYVYGSFVQSKMYRMGVRCADCHDAHSLQLHAEGNALCTQCHRADTYDSYDHHFHQQVYQGEPSDGALCVKCHMVEQPYMVIDWRADHSLRLPRPDLTEEIGVPNACTQSGCHDDRPLSWSLRSYREWYGTARRPHYGQVFRAARNGRPDASDQLIRIAGDPLYAAIVRATALTLLEGYPGTETTEAFNQALADEDALIRYTALSSLSAGSGERYVELVSPLLFDPVKAVRVEAAARLAGVPDRMLEPYQRDALTAGLDEYVRTMAYSLDFSFAGHNLGNLYARLGDATRAERYYRAAIEVDDLFYPAKVNLAVLLNAQRRNDEAERLLRDVVRDYPEQYDAAYSLGLLLAEMNRVGEAVEFLGMASAGMPERGRAHYNYGLALQAVGRIPEAEAALRRAVATEPQNPDFLFALGDHYLRRGNARRARDVADRILDVMPGNQNALQLRAAAEAALAR
jgi:tetratricopeptide (TPR) repeat protein